MYNNKKTTMDIETLEKQFGRLSMLSPFTRTDIIILTFTNSSDTHLTHITAYVTSAFLICLPRPHGQRSLNAYLSIFSAKHIVVMQ